MITNSVRDSLNARPIPVNPWDARLMTLSKSRHYTVLISVSKSVCVWAGVVNGASNLGLTKRTGVGPLVCSHLEFWNYESYG
jgi:hypothetical protein